MKSRIGGNRILMYKLILSLFWGLMLNNSFAQNGEFNFDRYIYGNAESWLEIDSISTWQIGKPNKKLFNTAHSVPNVIVTDTVNPYSVSDTSRFLIKYISYPQSDFGHRYTHQINGEFWVQSDTLNDYGTLEYSPNNGKVWINLLTDTIYNGYYSFYSDTPAFSGNSFGWKSFSIELEDVDRSFSVKNGDTVLYRFSFISDNKLDSLDGLMFDNIEVHDIGQSVNENERSIDSKAYPNPCKDELVLEFENESHSPSELYIYNQLGHEVLYKSGLTANKLKLNTKEYPRGIYYGYLRSKEGVISFKFVKE